MPAGLERCGIVLPVEKRAAAEVAYAGEGRTGFAAAAVWDRADDPGHGGRARGADVAYGEGLAAQAGAVANPSPYGYTVSLLLFIVPILTVGLWLVPQDGVQISKAAFVRSLAVLFPSGVILDFFFAHLFFVFPNAKATLGIRAPALGGGVPAEEYVFYFTGFVTILLIYIWLDEYWVAAYGVPSDAEERVDFQRLLRFHPMSLMWAVVVIAAAILYKHFVAREAGFPGYLTFLAVGALGPSALMFPAALPMINWRAFSLTLFVTLLTSLLWEATLALPYGWWNFQHRQMVGLYITAWYGLPIEEVLVWVAVSYQSVMVYEIVRRWKSSGKGLRHALFGIKAEAGDGIGAGAR